MDTLTCVAGKINSMFARAKDCSAKMLVKQRLCKLLVVSILVPISFAGCARARVNHTDVRAQEGAPVAAQVDLLTIPNDPNMPQFAVAVEPLQDKSNWGGSAGGDEDLGSALSSQLISTLTRGGNISVVDFRGLMDNEDGTYTIKKPIQNEVGPFILKGTITEFVEVAEGVESKSGGSLEKAASILGSIAGSSGSSQVNGGAIAAGVAEAANPTFENATSKRTGIITFDVQVLDGRTGRIIKSYPCTGRFTTATSKRAFALFNYGVESSEFAQCALGQAMRIAMNQALRQISQGLSTLPR